MKRSGLVSRVLVSLLVVSLALLACARTAAPTPLPAVTPTPKTTPARAAWQAEWERTLAEAKKEGRLIIHGTGVASEIRADMVKAFKDKYGIEVEFLGGPVPIMVEKLLTERRAGVFNADLWIGGSTTAVVNFKPAGALDPLDGVLLLPDVTDKKLWKHYDGPFYDKEHKIAGAFGTVLPQAYFNPEMVKPEELKSLNDLLAPKWKGRILINDGSMAGPGNAVWCCILDLMGEDYIRGLVKEQKPTLSRDLRQQVEWVVKGKFPLVVGTASSVVAEFAKAGGVLSPFVAQEGATLTQGIGAIGLINRAPHPSAARVFTNWFLTQEGQSLYARLSDHASRRVDVTNEWIDLPRKEKPGMRYILEDEEWNLKQGERMKLFREIFRPLM